MLEVRHLKKVYKTGNLITNAIDDISIEFRRNEFACILGPSGCGKTTFLNMLGVLDRPDSGDILINGNSLYKFKAQKLDSYRNKSIGFIFQKHNLINHFNLVENVEIGMALSGINSNTRRQIALSLLDKVGLKDHAYKKPSQISVGQSQRVAIARSLANNPDIILADEPTGSVDSETAMEILDLLKELSKDKLVIMVTHNKKMAYKYGTRVINLKDGKVINDTNPYDGKGNNEEPLGIKRTSMPFITSLKISLKTLKTKLRKVIFTILATVIGLIGVSLVLALSYGVKTEVAEYQEEILGNYPIEIAIDTISVPERKSDGLPASPDIDYVIAREVLRHKIVEQPNKLTNEFKEYVEEYYIKNKDQFSGLMIRPKMQYSIIREVIDINNKATYIRCASDNYSYTTRENSIYTALSQIPEGNIFYKLHDFVAGERPETANDIENKTFGILLYVDSFEKIHPATMTLLGFPGESETTDPKTFIGKELLFKPGSYSTQTFKREDAITLKITGVVKEKPNNTFTFMNLGFCYTVDLINYLYEYHSDAVGEPNFIKIFPKNFESKEFIKNHLDLYNDKFGPEEQEYVIQYMDVTASVFFEDNNTLSSISNGLTFFTAINLLVASIMILATTYTSVLERTKEIGILRSIGARKKDISRIFNSENIILGLVSGVLATLLSNILIHPLNLLLKQHTKFDKILQITYFHVLFVLIGSVLLSLLAGYIPAKIAARKDPAKVLMVE